MYQECKSFFFEIPYYAVLYDVNCANSILFFIVRDIIMINSQLIYNYAGVH